MPFIILDLLPQMYSRQYLNRFYDSSLLLTPEHRLMLGELLDMVSNGDKLTIAESCYAAVILPLSVPPIDPRLFPELENGVFDVLYHTYYSYLNGHPKARNAFELIPAEKQREDVILLERHYQMWKVEIENERHSEEVKKHVAAETRQQLREHKKLTANRGLGSNKLEYDRKSIVLQSKMIYLKVAEFYQELGILKQDLTRCGNEIWVDSYSYIHILFRHYFPSLNTHLQKDYHFDQSINFDNLPSYMRQFISRYFTTIDCQCFNRKSIYLRYRGTVYAMYFEPKQVFTGRSKRTVLRLETFFPVSVASLVNHVNQMSEKQASSELSFFY